MANPVNVEALGGGIGTKRAAAPIAFRDAVERRGAVIVGRHMEKIIDDCQAAWVPLAGEETIVTSSPEARKVNAKGVKIVNPVPYLNAILASRDIAAIDLSGYKYIGFWIKSDTKMPADRLQLILSKTAAGVNPEEILDIPSLSQDVWRYVRLATTRSGQNRNAVISVGIKVAEVQVPACTLFVDDIRAGNEYLGVADEMQDKDAYAPYDPVHIIDQGKAEVGLTGTALSGQYLEPVGNGKFAVSTNGVSGQDGMKTINSRSVAVEDQATENGTVPARMV